MPKYVVEHEYKEPLTDEKHQDEVRRADPCLAEYGVTWKATYLATDRMRAFCEFEAATAEEIMKALRSADVAFVRVWESMLWRAEKD